MTNVLRGVASIGALATILALSAFSITACTSAGHNSASNAREAASSIDTENALLWYESEIRAFEAADFQRPPELGQVLFIGSSTIRRWLTLSDDMAPARVLNRGFGGSTTADVLAVMDRIVFPYQASVIVYYCGDNDLGTSNTDSRAAAEGFKKFVERVHAEQPDTTILYLSIKPSLARWNNWAAMYRANGIVARFAAATKNVEYLDVASELLGVDGKPDPILFVDDGLHLSDIGYNRWTKIVLPRVLEVAGLH